MPFFISQGIIVYHKFRRDTPLVIVLHYVFSEPRETIGSNEVTSLLPAAEYKDQLKSEGQE